MNSIFILVIWIIVGIIMFFLRKDDDVRLWKIQYWLTYIVLIALLLSRIWFI